MATTLTIPATEELFGGWYERYVEEWGREPIVVTVHRIDQHWGGPEEGGWWYDVGYPIENICIFSKAQAIQELIRLHSQYEYAGEDKYDMNLDHAWARFYPEKRPHYC